MSTPSFFLVWCSTPGTISPSVRHATRFEAEQESKRLALKYPDAEFYVVQALSMARTPPKVEVIACDLRDYDGSNFSAPQVNGRIEDNMPF